MRPKNQAFPALSPKSLVNHVVAANTDFALDLYGRLAKENEGKNLFFSPYSVFNGLMIVAEGARGETAAQMGKVLRFPEAARRTGDEARLIPWNIAHVHAGIVTLNEQFNDANKPAPKEVEDKIATLRRELQAIKERAKEPKGESWWDLARKSREIASELNAVLSTVNPYEVRVVNAIWGDRAYPFKQSYLDTVSKYCGAGSVFPVDFRNDFEGARRRINAWADEHTHNRIKDLIAIDTIDEKVRERVCLILTSAIYFRGRWADEFDASRTKDDDFTLAGGQKVSVSMMHHYATRVAGYAAFNADGTTFGTPEWLPEWSGEQPQKQEQLYPDEHGFMMLELPYQGDELSMVVIVPQASDGLARVEKMLTSVNLQAWISKLQKRKVEVFLPKFKFDREYRMRGPLKAMGMLRAFDDTPFPDGAQFEAMCESTDSMRTLHIDQVLHKAFVAVNEKDTEAAAATAIPMPPPKNGDTHFKPTFRTDRPFIFLIRDKTTGNILFIGRMMDPRA